MTDDENLLVTFPNAFGLDLEHSMYVEDGLNQWHQRMFISE